MKTAVFPLENPEQVNSQNAFPESGDAFYGIPILPAYAVSSWTLNGNLHNGEYLYHPDGGRLNTDGFLMQNGYQYVAGLIKPKLSLSITYLGISDYEAFFPHIEDSGLKRRAAQLMEETDQTFEAGSWMSFAVVAGGVFECLLYDFVVKRGKAKKKMTLGKLMEITRKISVFDDEMFQSIVLAKDARNLVHADNYNQTYVSRADAMTIKLTLDSLLRLDWVKLL